MKCQSTRVTGPERPWAIFEMFIKQGDAKAHQIHRDFFGLQSGANTMELIRSRIPKWFVSTSLTVTSGAYSSTR